MDIKQIKKPIDQELEIFEENFRLSMKSKVPLLDKITHYIVKRKGKQIRPMFVLLSANVCGGINQSTYRGAALVELLHTATLVHDDVVDNAYERRSFFSINALWKNKIAVLVGDYLLAKGLLLAVDNSDFKLLKIVSEAVKEMSEGELLQIEKARKFDITEELYFEVIKKKTASLIASCCACGAASANEDLSTVAKMKSFGEKVGIAFQIKDDLLDFGYSDIGKPRAADIKDKKITLPLILALKNASSSEKSKMIYILRNQTSNNTKVQEVISFVHEKNGMQGAEEKMNQLIKEALEILKNFPESESRSSLESLVKFSIEREK